MNISYNKKGRMSYIGLLEEQGVPHEIVYTNRTYKVTSELGKRTFTTKDIRKRGMAFIAKVRRHIDNSGVKDLIPKVDYVELGLVRYRFSKESRTGLKYGLIEFDLDKAYWRSARNLGVITEELYQEGLSSNFTKIELLATLGSLAKFKCSRMFDGKKYGRSVIVDDSSETRHIWDAISFAVDKCMIDCANELGKDFYIYWTDAIFFRNTKENLDKVRQIAEFHGFSGKVIPIAYAVGSQEKTTVYTKYNKSHAEMPLRDAKGNYGREFTSNIQMDTRNYYERVSKLYEKSRVNV